MTTKEVIKDILQRRGTKYNINGHTFYTEESVVACLNEILQRFEDAFEVDSIEECYDDNLDVMHELYGFNTRKIGTTQTHKIYAIPKEQDE